MTPPTDPNTAVRCPIVTPDPDPRSEFVLHCEREAGHEGDHVSGGYEWADELGRIMPAGEREYVILPPGR
jgi:hypothetical protein